MPKTIAHERYQWIKRILEKKLIYNEVLRARPHSKCSLERRMSVYRKNGFDGLVAASIKPTIQPNETPIRIKEEVIALRNKTGLRAQKLHWRLQKTHGLTVTVRTIGKILKGEGLVRTYRKKKVKYKYIKTQRQLGELVEIDVKYVPVRIAGKRYYQYTATERNNRKITQRRQ